VPGIETFDFGNFDAVQALDNGEQPAQYLVDREVGAQGFLRHAVALLTQFFAKEAGVPAFQLRGALLAGVGLQLLKVAGSERLAALGQVTQEGQHLIRCLGHFGGQAQLGEAGKTQQLGQLLTQVENFFHHRAVVELAGIRALVRGAGAVSRVDFFAQGAVFGVGHHREVAGELEADQPAVQALGLCGSRHLRLGRVGQARQCCFVGDVLGPGLGGVQQLVGELAAQLGKLALYLGVTLLLGLRQVDTRQAEVAQRMLKNGFLGLVEVADLRAVGQGFKGLEQFAVLAHLGGVSAQCRQAGLIGFTQLCAVAHRVKVADRAPGRAQPVVQLIHRQYQACPCRVLALILEDGLNAGTVVGEDLLDGRLYVLRTDRRERRQVIGLQ